MKYGKMLVIVLAVFAGTSAVNAGVSAQFEGDKTDGSALVTVFKGNEKTDVIAVPEPVQIVSEKKDAAKVTLNISMKTGLAEKNETFLCQVGADRKRLENCSKENDNVKLTADEVNDLFLERYFPRSEEPDFESLLEISRHSYCNSSGPQEFCCDDKCAHYAMDGGEMGTGGASAHWTCTDWTHECSCTKNCY